MKKSYICPLSSVINIRVESLIADSLKSNSIMGDQITNGGNDTEGKWANVKSSNYNVWDDNWEKE